MAAARRTITQKASELPEHLSEQLKAIKDDINLGRLVCARSNLYFQPTGQSTKYIYLATGEELFVQRCESPVRVKLPANVDDRQYQSYCQVASGPSFPRAVLINLPKPSHTKDFRIWHGEDGFLDGLPEILRSMRGSSRTMAIEDTGTPKKKRKVIDTAPMIDPNDRLSDDDYMGVRPSAALHELLQTRPRSDKPSMVMKLLIPKEMWPRLNNIDVDTALRHGETGSINPEPATATDQSTPASQTSTTVDNFLEKKEAPGPAQTEEHVTENTPANIVPPALHGYLPSATEPPATPMSPPLSMSNTPAPRRRSVVTAKCAIVDLTHDGGYNNAKVKTEAQTTPPAGKALVQPDEKATVRHHTILRFFDDNKCEIDSEPFSKFQSSSDLFTYARAHFGSSWAKGERNVLLANVNGGKPLSIVQADKDHYEKLTRTIEEDGCWGQRREKIKDSEEVILCIVGIQLL